jgi:hypothetical protein
VTGLSTARIGARLVNTAAGMRDDEPQPLLDPVGVDRIGERVELVCCVAMVDQRRDVPVQLLASRRD